MEELRLSWKEIMALDFYRICQLNSPILWMEELLLSWKGLMFFDFTGFFSKAKKTRTSSYFCLLRRNPFSPLSNVNKTALKCLRTQIRLILGWRIYFKQPNIQRFSGSLVTAENEN
jgi:hypothetical protein